MRKFTFSLATGLLLALTACGVNVDSGTVSDKRAVEAYSEEVEVMEEECTTETETKYKTVNGKRTSYTDTDTECEDVATGEFETVDHPAEFYVTLSDKEGNDEEHEVDQEQYDAVEVGDALDLSDKG